MSIHAEVRNRIQRIRRGAPFAISGFYEIGSPSAVQKALSRLAKSGTIVRVAKGFYSRPKENPFVPKAKVVASPEQIAQVWAKERGYRLVSQGMEAAYRLGLQTQAPMRKVFWSNGPSRRFRVGHNEVEVRHVANSKLRWAGLPEGVMFRGLNSITPESAEPGALSYAMKRLSLSGEQAKSVLSKLKSAPIPKAWQKRVAEFEQTFH